MNSARRTARRRRGTVATHTRTLDPGQFASDRSADDYVSIVSETILGY